MVEATTSNKVNVDLTKLKGVKGINYDEYNMIETKIAEIEIKDFAKPGEKENLSMIIKTEPIGQLGIQAKESISLFRDEDGSVCYSEKPNSNSGKMLNFFKVESFDELVGLKVTSLVKTKQDGSERIGFYFG